MSRCKPCPSAAEIAELNRLQRVFGTDLSNHSFTAYNDKRQKTSSTTRLPKTTRTRL